MLRSGPSFALPCPPPRQYIYFSVVAATTTAATRLLLCFLLLLLCCCSSRSALRYSRLPCLPACLLALAAHRTGPLDILPHRVCCVCLYAHFLDILGRYIYFCAHHEDRVVTPPSTYGGRRRDGRPTRHTYEHEPRWTEDLITLAEDVHRYINIG